MFDIYKAKLDNR